MHARPLVRLQLTPLANAALLRSKRTTESSYHGSIMARTLVNFCARHYHGITRADPARLHTSPHVSTDHTCHLNGGLSSIRSEFSFFFHLAFELPGSMVEPNSKLSAYSAYSPGISARSLVEWR